MERECGVSQPTISKWVNQVISALDTVSSRYIYLPDMPEELAEIARGYEHYGRSRVLLQELGAGRGPIWQPESCAACRGGFPEFDGVESQTRSQTIAALTACSGGGRGSGG